jgi:hypothetical protein
MEATPRNQPPMQKPSRPLKIKTNFGNNGAIIKKQEVFQEIGQQLLSSKHTLTLGQLMHLALGLKQYAVSKLSPNSQPTNPQAPPCDLGLVTIDLHMAIILVHARKNIVEDVMLDGGSSVNIITKDLRKKLRLPIPKLAPYTLRMVD